MNRINIEPRQNWVEKIKEQGFLFHDLDNYYEEKAAYELSAAEVDQIDIATAKIFEMCVKAVQHVIDNNLWDRMFIPKEYAALITRSWNEDHCSFYGRFDLAFNKNGEIKLLEFNADTPTGLLEAAVIQWYWLQDYNKSLDQFNSIHEKLVAHMKACKPYFGDGRLYFSAIRDHVEDFMTVKYMEDCARQAGVNTEFIYIEDLSVDENGRFCTKMKSPIDNIFKLYPWEWMVHEEFGQYLDSPVNATMNWIEPPYKSILSNKMLLVILHELFPDSPYILPAVYNEPRGKDYVKKPVFSREGANITIVRDGGEVENTEGDYGEEGFVIQDYFELPDFDGNKPIIGSWVIGGESAGIGIREGTKLITNNTSKFIPHYFK
jgi:glutathionylspermidine synthase